MRTFEKLLNRTIKIRRRMMNFKNNFKKTLSKVIISNIINNIKVKILKIQNARSTILYFRTLRQMNRINLKMNFSKMKSAGLQI